MPWSTVIEMWCNWQPLVVGANELFQLVPRVAAHHLLHHGLDAGEVRVKLGAETLQAVLGAGALYVQWTRGGLKIHG